MKSRLWWYVGLLAIFIGIGWITGADDAASIMLWLVIGFLVVCFTILIIDGFLELRERRNGDR